MKVVQLTTDSREHFKDYANPNPYFGAAPEALLQGFARRSDVEVHVVSCVRQPMVSPEKLALNIWYHALPVPKVGWLTTGYQGCIRAVRRKVREIRPDIVHGQGTEKDCALTAVWSGFPNVLTLHGIMADMAQVFDARRSSYYWFAERLERYALRHTSGVLCNSSHTQSMAARFSAQTWLVPNMLRLDFFEPLDRSRTIEIPKLLNIGHVNSNKQQLELLRVASEWQRAGAKFRLHFLGHATGKDDYSREFLRRVGKAEQAGWARHVGFYAAKDLVSLLDTSAALIHVPQAETFGLVVAEALSRNLKLFGFRAGGVPDIAEGVKGAELFPPGRWDDLGRAVQQWLAVGAALPVGAAAVMKERYHPDVVAGRHIEIYKEVLSKLS